MANYILRQFDDALWQRFKARAQGEGRGLRWVLLELIRMYADGRVSVNRESEG
jgi:hypothetical protein